jgi:hypothetical protein
MPIAGLDVHKRVVLPAKSKSRRVVLRFPSVSAVIRWPIIAERAGASIGKDDADQVPAQRNCTYPIIYLSVESVESSLRPPLKTDVGGVGVVGVTVFEEPVSCSVGGVRD